MTYEVADLAANSEDRCKKLMVQMCILKREFEEEEYVCGNGNSKLIPIGICNDSTSCGDGLVIPKETTNMLDPLVVWQKGRPPFKRKQPKQVEKAVKKKKEQKKKMRTTTNEENIVKQTKTPITKGNVILCFCMQLFTIIINFCHFTFCRKLSRLEMCEICGTTPSMRVGVLETHENFNFNVRLSSFLYYLEVGDIVVMFKVY